MNKDFRPENKPIPVRKTGQNCSKTIPKASPEKPEIAYKPRARIWTKLGGNSSYKRPRASYTAQGP